MDDEYSLNYRKRKFPNLQELGTDVYDVDKVVFRDNSRFVTELMKDANVIFTRPPQMGKTTLLSLAELLLSDTETAPEGLESYPPDGDKNSWYVISVTFGGIRSCGYDEDAKWEDTANEVDRKVRLQISGSILSFLRLHEDVKRSFNEDLTMDKLNFSDLDAGQLVFKLTQAITAAHKTSNTSTKPRILFLVDEYDKPIRDILFDYIGTKIPNIKDRMSMAFSQYVSFFDNIKNANTPKAKVVAWVTGITPVGLTLISDFRCKDVTFDKKMADAVGLLNKDVSNMLEAAIDGKSFDEEERERVLEVLRLHFNNLRFFGEPLYHTGMMNAAMTQLQEAVTRHEWLRRVGELVRPEELPSSAFDVIKRAGTSDLRSVVSQLADKEILRGYELKRDMSIMTLLERGVLGTDEYLTLLVHLGVVSITYDRRMQPEFRSTSEMYRKKHLTALNLALASSISDLLKCESKQEMYQHGESILLEFLHALSAERMAKLIAWAASGEGNRILELQFQGNIVEFLHEKLEAITTQEDKLDAGRSDITVSTERCQVILELKKKDGASAPTAKEWERYHSQLRNYVQELRTKAKSGHWVAGFVLVMFNGGTSFLVQKLTNDDIVAQ